MGNEIRMPAAFLALHNKYRPQKSADDISGAKVSAEHESHTAEVSAEPLAIIDPVSAQTSAQNSAMTQTDDLDFFGEEEANPNVAVAPLHRPPLHTQWTSTSSFKGGVDRYGFKIQNSEEYNTWSARYEVYCQHRKRKWEYLLKQYGLAPPAEKTPVRFPPASAKLKRYIRKGIPAEWRGNAWFWYSRAQEKLHAHPGLYDRLVQQSLNLKNNDTEHIERDLYRTFPDNIYFRSDPVTGKESPLLQALRRVLTCFSVYQPKIGYCQSLNFIAGTILLFNTEERTFWMLVNITQSNFYLAGLHEVNLEQVNISQGVLMCSIRDRLPKVWASLGLEQTYQDNFVSNLPPVSLCTASWFMSMMVNVLPTETMMRVWDCFFFEGIKVLYRVSLTIFKLIEPDLVRINDDLEAFQLIQTYPRKLMDPKALMSACFKRANGFGHISYEDIAVLREFVDQRRRNARQEKPQKANTGQKAISTTDRDEYAKFHPGRRLRAKLSLYK